MLGCVYSLLNLEIASLSLDLAESEAVLKNAAVSAMTAISLFLTHKKKKKVTSYK